jgi:hypothetical protein
MATKWFLLAVVTATACSLAGCSTCRRMTPSWFNRGDKCCAPPACPPGIPQQSMMMPGATMMPGTPQVLPGPIEVAPTF